MTTVPNNYPLESSDEEIVRAIKDLSEEVLNSGANINIVLQLTPLIGLGQNELSKRLIASASRTSTKLGKIAITVAGVAILLSGIAIYFTYISTKENEVFQNQQLQILRQIEQGISHLTLPAQPPQEP